MGDRVVSLPAFLVKHCLGPLAVAAPTIFLKRKKSGRSQAADPPLLTPSRPQWAFTKLTSAYCCQNQRVRISVDWSHSPTPGLQATDLTGFSTRRKKMIWGPESEWFWQCGGMYGWRSTELSLCAWKLLCCHECTRGSRAKGRSSSILKSSIEWAPRVAEGNILLGHTPFTTDT